MALPSFMTSGRSTVVVRIYSYQEKCPNGTLQGLHFNSPVEFSSLTQMLLLMEEMLDSVNGPQRGESPRAFQKTGREKASGNLPAQRALPAERKLAGNLDLDGQDDGFPIPQRAGAGSSDGQRADSRPGMRVSYDR